MNTTMNATMNEGIMEGEKKMVRKAETLESLDELDLCDRARRYYAYAEADIEWLIWHSRWFACDRRDFVRRNYYYGNNFEHLTNLTVALDKAGFIRHDITERSFLFGKIFSTFYYKDHNVYPDCFEGIDLLSLDHCDDEEIYSQRNIAYEIFRNPTDEQYEIVKKHAKDFLSDREYSIFLYMTGINDGKRYIMKEIAPMFGVTPSRIQQLTKKIQSKFRRNAKEMLDELKPTITYFVLPRVIAGIVSEDYAELDPINQRVIFNKAMEFEQELRKLQRLSERIATLMQATSLDA